MPLLSKPPEPNSKAYYLKLLILVADKGKSVLQDVFDREIPPAILPGVLAKSKIRKKLRKLQRMKILYQYQMNNLYPSSGIVKSADFDVSLLIILLRNTCNITTSPDDTVWKSKPLPTDKSVAADIVRIKEMRNDLCHRTNLALKESDFDNKWDELKDALVRLGGKTKYEEDIDNIKASSPDPEMEEHYRQLLKDREEEDAIMKEEIHNLKTELHEMKQRNAEAEINIRTKFKLFCAGTVVVGWTAGCTYFLNRYGADPEAVKGLVQKAIIPGTIAMGATVVHIMRGSIIIKVKVTSLQALSYLWKSCDDGEMEKNLHNVIVTDGLMKEAPPGTDSVGLSVTISEEEYQTARQILLNSCQSSIQSHGKRDSEHLDLEERQPPRKRMRCDETSLSSTDNCHPKEGVNGDDAQNISAGSLDPDVLTENACTSHIVTESSGCNFLLREIDEDNENSFEEALSFFSQIKDSRHSLHLRCQHEMSSSLMEWNCWEETNESKLPCLLDGHPETSSTDNCTEQDGKPKRDMNDLDTQNISPGSLDSDVHPLFYHVEEDLLARFLIDSQPETSSTDNCTEQDGKPKRDMNDLDTQNISPGSLDSDVRLSSFNHRKEDLFERLNTFVWNSVCARREILRVSGPMENFNRTATYFASAKEIHHSLSVNYSPTIRDVSLHNIPYDTLTWKVLHGLGIIPKKLKNGHTRLKNRRKKHKKVKQNIKAGSLYNHDVLIDARGGTQLPCLKDVEESDVIDKSDLISHSRPQMDHTTEQYRADLEKTFVMPEVTSIGQNRQNYMIETGTSSTSMIPRLKR